MVATAFISRSILTPERIVKRIIRYFIEAVSCQPFLHDWKCFVFFLCLTAEQLLNRSKREFFLSRIDFCCIPSAPETIDKTGLITDRTAQEHRFQHCRFRITELHTSSFRRIGCEMFKQPQRFQHHLSVLHQLGILHLTDGSSLSADMHFILNLFSLRTEFQDFRYHRRGMQNLTESFCCLFLIGFPAFLSILTGFADFLPDLLYRVRRGIYCQMPHDSRCFF